MSILHELRTKARSQVQLLQEKFLGVNNERLEFVLDSFYKLEPAYRNAVLGTVGGCVLLFILAAGSIYVRQVQQLKGELNQTFNAMNELKNLAKEDARELARLEQLLERVRLRTTNLTFKPFFERLARQANIPVKSLADRLPEMDPQNPLAERMQEVQIEMKLSKVSIPRMLNFMVDIEKADHYLRVQNLKVTGIYGNKLFFDVDMLIRGYKVVR